MHRPFTSAVALLFTVTPLLAQEKFTLRNQFQPGAVGWVRQSQEQSQSMDMGGGGKPMKSTMQSSMVMETKVAEVKDGVAAVDQRYARITLRSDAPGMQIDYDSDVEGSKPGPALRSLAELVGKTAKLRVDANGKMLECTLPDDLGEDLERAGISMKEGIQAALAVWPTKPVAIGETWESELEFPMAQMGAMKAKVTNKLIAVKDHLVTVERKMLMDLSGLKLPPGVKMEVPKAEATGTFDMCSPMPVDCTMEMVMKMGPAMTLEMRTTTKKVDAPAAKAPPKAEAPAPGK